MQEASIPLEFLPTEIPELRPDSLYSPDSLPVLENSLVEHFPSEVALWSSDASTKRAMQYVYYIGEAFRRAFEGLWVAVPTAGDPTEAALPMVDLPFRETFVNPIDLIGICVVRRTGNEISRLFRYAANDYHDWVTEGRKTTHRK